MAKKTLVIDSRNLERFFLIFQSGTLQIGDSPAHPEGTVQGLRVVRIRCEVEIDEERDSVPIDQAGVISPQVLRLDTDVRLTHAHLSLRPAEVGNGPAAVPASAPPEPPAPHSPATGPKRLKVTDGADQGRSFAIPDSGTVSVGKVGQAAIGLDDLYVAKIHCTLTVDHGTVCVTHVEGQSGTLIDNKKITQSQPMKPGSVLRVGNSHLRLEVGPFPDAPVAAPIESAKKDGSGPSRALPTDGSKVMRAAGSGTTPAPSRSGDPFTELVGQTIGPYLADRLLGRGHSGATFHATNTKSGQVVALKVLAPEFPASPAELERFAQEFKTVRPIQHANLVGLLGAGKTTTHCWIATDFVEGESAAAVIARLADGEKPSWTRAARVVVQLARTLEFLHQHQLIHGNITPRTVLLRTSDHATRLADLRLAQLLAGSQLQKKVAEAELLAALPYRAPEQVAAGGFVDSLADLYAVGALAYALCTGRRPVTGQSPAEIRDHILNGSVSKPSLVYKKVPPAFDAIVLKLTARNQEDRYQTASAVLADLVPVAESHDLKL